MAGKPHVLLGVGERLRKQIAVVGGSFLYVGLLAVLLAEHPGVRQSDPQLAASRRRVRRRGERHATTPRPAPIAARAAEAEAAFGDAEAARTERSEGGCRPSDRASLAWRPRTHGGSARASGSRGRTAKLDGPRTPPARRGGPHRARAAEGRFQRPQRRRSVDPAALLAPAGPALAPDTSPPADVRPPASDEQCVRPSLELAAAALGRRLRLATVGSKLATLPPSAHVLLVVVALAAVAIAGYIVLISPKRSAAAGLQAQIRATDAQIQGRRGPSNGAAPRLEIAEMFQLAKAMPAQLRMPDVIFELTRLAGSAGVSIDSIAPQPAVQRDGHPAVPIVVAATGKYFALSDFVARIRKLVRIDQGRIRASGRLFTIDAVSFAESGERFPNLQATLTVSARVYDPAPTGSQGGS